MEKVRLTAAIILFIVSLTVLGWGLWPTLNQPHILLLTPTEMAPPTPSSFMPAVVAAG